MALQIGNISATPTYSTRSRTQVLNAAGVSIPIWSVMGIPANEGPDGSSCCCTFEIPTDTLAMPLTLQGVWPGLSAIDFFTIKASINGTDLLIARNVPSPRTPVFVVPMNALLLVAAPTFPCRYAGDWSWSISPNGGRNKMLNMPTFVNVLIFGRCSMDCLCDTNTPGTKFC